MLCINMNSQGVPSQNEKNASPNPLNCPPSLLLNQQQAQAFTNNQLQVDPSNPSGLLFNNDFMQQSNNPNQISSGNVSRQTSHGSTTSNQQGGGNMMASTNNLQEQIVASLASQLMSRRQMMMNYDLSGNGNLFHPGISNGSNQGLMSRLTDAKVNQHGQINGGRYQQASLNRVPCQARGMSTDHNALVSYPYIHKNIERYSCCNISNRSFIDFVYRLPSWKSQMTQSMGFISCALMLLVALLV